MENVKSGYAAVNGLHKYYEIHGAGQPLVLLHGAFSAIGTSFEKLLPDLARSRRVVAFELQAHGRTADIDRPLTLEGMADDVAAALRQLGVGQADIFGCSMGAGVALHVALRHPDAVRRLVLASVTYRMSGVHPGLMEGLANMAPEAMVGTPGHEEYMRIAPQGGILEDTPAGLPDSQLAILPGTSLVSLAHRAELLIPMISSFLDAPNKEHGT